MQQIRRYHHLLYRKKREALQERRNVMSGKIYVRVLIFFCVFLLGLLAAGCVRVVVRGKGEGTFIKSIQICFLLLVFFGVLGFMNTLFIY